jgi:nicotinamide-nucleotide amidase
MTDFSALTPAAEALITLCRKQGYRIATAESCTGGLLAGILTEIPGSSEVFDRGLVTYSNPAKIDLLGVSPDLLAPGGPGAVSEAVARAMAEGAVQRSQADLALAITGVAGPSGGTEEKPIGLVHFALAVRDGETHHHERRFGDLGRSAVRLASVSEALAMLSHAAHTRVAP